MKTTFTKKTMVGAMAIFIVLVVFFSYKGFSRYSNNDPIETADMGSSLNGDASDTSMVGAGEDPATGGDSNISLNKENIVAKLRDLYTAGIYHPRIQLEAIEALIRHLKKLYPNDWESHVWEYLLAAFPDYAKEMFENYRKLAAYKKWIKDNYNSISGLQREKLDALMFEKRKEYFGSDAQKIWELEIKNKEVEGVLSDLQNESELPFDEKANYFRNRLNAIYGDISDPYIKAHQQKLMNQFLNVGSVQNDLHGMTKSERKEQLTSFRKTMGLDDEAIQRWDSLDEIRDSRWAKGQSYMKEKETLSKTTSGQAFEQKLGDLRKKYFGTEAETIAAEEKSGFERFKRDRVYGKN